MTGCFQPGARLNLLAVLQIAAGVRVAWRLVRTAQGTRIARRHAALPGERVTVLLPVLDEASHIASCLAGLMAQPREVTQILVIDGGSRDGTICLAAEAARRDGRIRLLDAAPIPPEVNGKAHALQFGLDHADPRCDWVLTVDADVEVAPQVTRSLLTHARQEGLAAASIATRQRLSGALEGVVHPAMLATLVYRFGIPGQATRDVSRVQANGQCALYHRATLEQVGGFALALGSLCEDVTIARALAAGGHAVGFHEAGDLATAAMYDGWRSTWDNWPRSLPLRDRYSGLGGWLGLVEIVLVQAAPLPALLAMLARGRRPRLLWAVNLALLLIRVGVLLGTARAYVAPPWTYWLSPLVDLPVALRLWGSALRRRHRWRGRVVVRAEG